MIQMLCYSLTVLVDTTELYVYVLILIQLVIFKHVHTADSLVLCHCYIAHVDLYNSQDLYFSVHLFCFYWLIKQLRAKRERNICPSNVGGPVTCCEMLESTGKNACDNVIQHIIAVIT